MLVTMPGISILVRLSQPENAPSPMLIMSFGIIVFLEPEIRVFVAVSIIALQFSRLS